MFAAVLAVGAAQSVGDSHDQIFWQASGWNRALREPSFPGDTDTAAALFKAMTHLRSLFPESLT